MDLPLAEWGGPMAQVLEPAVSWGSSGRMRRDCARLLMYGVDLAMHAFLRAHVHVVDGAQAVADYVDAGDGEHDASFGGDGVGVGFGVVIDAAREGVEVGAEGWVLGGVPGLSALGDAVELDPAVEREMVGAPIFGGAAARFAIEHQQQIALRLSLRPAFGIEHGRAV